MFLVSRENPGALALARHWNLLWGILKLDDLGVLPMNWKPQYNNDHQNHLLVCPYQPSLPIMYIVEVMFKTPWLTYFGISSVYVILIASPSVISHIAGTSTSWTSISEAPSCRVLFYYSKADFMFHVPILFPFSMIDPWCLCLCLCSPINLLNTNKDAHDLIMMLKNLVFSCTSNVFFHYDGCKPLDVFFIKHYKCLKFKYSNFL